MNSSIDTEYTLQIVVGGLAPRWTKVVRYPDDATAIAASGRLVASEASTLRGRTSLLVGRGTDEDVHWLGAWHLDEEPAWMPA
ncbi:hypothetical protein [uncultured Phenylobacterium sp.]|uniref:hypothetical protein n=1 Tax=uncultured Phenylobacterium sp. TaxID=349273 RepID=UPI002600B9F5|nr:hypothetical protein [uncultured Phenylobacterium sp.]